VTAPNRSCPAYQSLTQSARAPANQGCIAFVPLWVIVRAAPAITVAFMGCKYGRHAGLVVPAVGIWSPRWLQGRERRRALAIRADAGFANAEVYEFLNGSNMPYVCRQTASCRAFFSLTFGISTANSVALAASSVLVAPTAPSRPIVATGDADFFAVGVGLVVEVFKVRLGGDACINFLLAGDARGPLRTGRKTPPAPGGTSAYLAIRRSIHQASVPWPLAANCLSRIRSRFEPPVNQRRPMNHWARLPSGR
jgi:hypothetical protein